MTIIMLSADFKPLIGGIASHVYHLSRALAKHGINIRIVVPTASEEQKIKRIHEGKLTIYRCRYRRSPRRWKHLYRQHRAAVRGLELALIKPDREKMLIHQHDVRATKPSAIWARRQYNVPLIWTWHSHNIFTRGDLRNRWFLRALRFKADGVITVSSRLYHQIKDLPYSSGQAGYIPNGICRVTNPKNLEIRPSLEILPSDFVVFSPARMHPSKGVIYLAKAIKNIVDVAPNVRWKFIFAGSGEGSNIHASYRDRIRTLLDEEKQKGLVHFIGNISQERMASFYQIADVVVNTTLSDAIGITDLEAMAMEKPLIRFGFKERTLPFIHNKHIYFVNTSVKALAAGIRSLHQDDKKRNRLATRARKLVYRTRRWEQIADQTIAFYQDVWKEIRE